MTNAPGSQQLSLESRYRLIVESIKDYAVFMLNADGTVATWNAGAQRIKGYAADEIIGQHFSRFYSQEDQAAGIPALALKTAATQGKFEAEGWRMRKDGSRFWAHVVIDPVRDPSGALVGYTKITRDITEKKEALDRLRESERQFRFLINGLTDYAIYMISPTGVITNWNSGAQRIKGFTAEEVIGTHFSRFYTKEDQAIQKPAKALEIASREGKYEAEGWRVRKDGTTFWAQVTLDAIYDEGKLIGFAKMTRDITERRQAAEKLQEAQIALAQAQKMESIGKLTGGIAHDFSNLLQGIIGHLDMMRLRIALGRTSELGHHLDAAISATKRASTLTHRLLAFARRQTLIPKPVDVTWLVHSMMDLLRRTVGPDIEIESQISHDLWWAYCDQNQLESALLNLVINARDSMKDGGKIVVRTANVTVGDKGVPGDPNVPRGEYVVLSVKDEGCGMPPEVLAQAFEPFFTTKPVGEGTGLGLSMVHGFMSQSGGYVALESKPDLGTTASLYFPRHEAQGDAPKPEVSAKTVRPRARKRMTVLVVDDERAVRTTLTEVLEHLGYDLLVAADAHDALRVFESNPHIDLLVTDVALRGGMNGKQLASQMRLSDPALKVLFITGYAEQSVIGHEALPAGMQLIVKPFSIDTFVAMVHNITEDA
jgi:PAS domain S-box-containing protein